MNSRQSIFDDPFNHVHATFIFSLMVVFCVWALDFHVAFCLNTQPVSLA